MIMTWDDDPQRKGYMDVSNLMTNMMHNLFYLRKIGNFVLTDDPVHFMEVVDSFKDFFPYFVGGVSMHFYLRTASPAFPLSSLGVEAQQPEVGIEGGQAGWQDITQDPLPPDELPNR